METSWEPSDWVEACMLGTDQKFEERKRKKERKKERKKKGKENWDSACTWQTKIPNY